MQFLRGTTEGEAIAVSSGYYSTSSLLVKLKTIEIVHLEVLVNLDNIRRESGLINMEYLTLETHRADAADCVPLFSEDKVREICDNLRDGNRETVVLHGLGEETERAAGKVVYSCSSSPLTVNGLHTYAVIRGIFL